MGGVHERPRVDGGAIRTLAPRGRAISRFAKRPDRQRNCLGRVSGEKRRMQIGQIANPG